MKMSADRCGSQTVHRKIGTHGELTNRDFAGRLAALMAISGVLIQVRRGSKPCMRDPAHAWFERTAWGHIC